MLAERLESLDEAPLAKQCAWCKRFKDGEQWQDLGHRENVHNITLDGRTHRVSHGICPACQARLEAQERRWRREMSGK